jgi:hypothetical protein
MRNECELSSKSRKGAGKSTKVEATDGEVLSSVRRDDRTRRWTPLMNVCVYRCDAEAGRFHYGFRRLLATTERSHD